MTKPTGIGRGGRRAGGRPASGLPWAQINTKVSGPRMAKYKKYLADRGEPATDEDVKRWIRQIFMGELASLDEMIDGDLAGKNACLQTIYG